MIILNWGSRSQWPRGLRCGSAAARWWDCRFESLRRHGCLSLVTVLCCQVEVCVGGGGSHHSSGGVLPTVVCLCVCVSLCVIKCNNNPVRLQRICGRDQAEKRKSRILNKRTKIYLAFFTISSRAVIAVSCTYRSVYLWFLKLYLFPEYHKRTSVIKASYPFPLSACVWGI